MSGAKADWHDGVIADKGQRSRNEILKFYNKNAELYDHDMTALEYNGPKLMAQLIHDYFKSNQSAHLLDIGAGTGTELLELRKFGNYPNITALDASAPMLDILEERKLCNSKICQLFGKDSSIPADSYDGVMTIGSFAPEHLGLDSLEEMCKIVKPGGLILIMSREVHFHQAEFTDNKFFDKCTELEKDGKWISVCAGVVPNYFADLNGYKLVLKKC